MTRQMQYESEAIAVVREISKSLPSAKNQRRMKDANYEVG